MNARLASIPRTHELEGVRVIVTGCGYAPVKHVFHANVAPYTETHDSIWAEDGEEMKVNIGTATAFVLAAKGAVVHLVSRSMEKLDHIVGNIDMSWGEGHPQLERSPVDLLDEEQVAEFVAELPMDKQIYWVQSIGLGAGSYQLQDGNPYLRLEDIPLQLLEMETSTVLRGTHIMMQALLPLIREMGGEARIAVVSSMSAIRGYGLGGTHCAAKGAISRYVNAAMLALWKEGIYVTDVRPGAVDTGMYDSEVVQKAILEVDADYGNYYNQNGLQLAPPISIGYAIATAFTVPAHVPSINLVAQGQFPNEGS